jgi:cell filamentation protein
MRNDYKYIDPDYTYTYTDPATGVLRNLGNISSSDALLFFESTAVIKRTKELEKKPVKIKDSSTLLVIHKHLFQDVYAWAGKERTVTNTVSAIKDAANTAKSALSNFASNLGDTINRLVSTLSSSKSGKGK